MMTGYRRFGWRGNLWIWNEVEGIDIRLFLWGEG